MAEISLAAVRLLARAFALIRFFRPELLPLFHFYRSMLPASLCPFKQTQKLRVHVQHEHSKQTFVLSTILVKTSISIVVFDDLIHHHHLEHEVHVSKFGETGESYNIYVKCVQTLVHKSAHNLNIFEKGSWKSLFTAQKLPSNIFKFENHLRDDFETLSPWQPTS